MGAMVSAPAEAPFIRIGPEAPLSPVVLSVPHAGRSYPETLLRSSRLPPSMLETLEDRLVDRLVWRAVANGSIALVAQSPRAEIDLNRDEREIDPAMVIPPLPSRSLLQSPRTRGGLGLVPSRITGAGSIWLHRLQGSELARRIDDIHRPYHAALAALLEDARKRFGVAILLDCHSMPPRGALSGPQADVVLGDRHGTSMAPELLDAAVEAAERSGFEVARNIPYAGGHITARHGQPARGIHALQIEVDRSLYLDPELREPGGGFDKVAQMIAEVARALAGRALEPAHAVAAE